MAKIDESRPFKPVHIAVLCVSSTRTLEEDKSGAKLEELATDAGHKVIERKVVKDNFDAIREALIGWIQDSNIHVVISTGGTGVTGSDVTPEAFESLYDKSIP